MMTGWWCQVYSKKQKSKPTQKNKQMKRIPEAHGWISCKQITTSIDKT